MIVYGLPVGPLGANFYLVGDKSSREAAIIDPGAEYDRILQACAAKQLTIKMILLTHAHFDHAGVAAPIKKLTGAELCCHEAELPFLRAMPVIAQSFGLSVAEVPEVDRCLADGDVLQLGAVSIRVIHTPGHSPGGLCFYAHPCLFTGDTLFRGGVGRTDLPGGDQRALMRSIREKLMPLDDDVVVFPGHMAQSDLGTERRHNPFLHLE